MKNIISCFPKAALKASSDLFAGKGNVTFSGGGNSSSKAMVIADILRADDKERPFLWVVSSKNEVSSVVRALNIWAEEKVYAYEYLSSESLAKFGSMSALTKARDLAALEFSCRLNSNKRAVFVLDVDSVFTAFPQVGKTQNAGEKVFVGQDFDPVSWIDRLVRIGYEVGDDLDLKKGQYVKRGDFIYVYPVNSEAVMRLDLDFDKLAKIAVLKDGDKVDREILEFAFMPIDARNANMGGLLDVLPAGAVIIDDEVDVMDEDYENWNAFLERAGRDFKLVSFSTFNDDVANHQHLHLMSVLKYRTAYDFANDLRDKIKANWSSLIFTKHLEEVRGLLADQNVPFKEGLDAASFKNAAVFVVPVEKDDVFPLSFQAPVQKICLLTDPDLGFLRENKKKENNNQNVFNDFLTGLKAGDFVVHADHGIAKFLGLEQKTVDGVTKEYLKLGYAENDKLFVPIDQADKVNKYIGSEELMPKLTRLGSSDWSTMTSKVKKETQKIAKELLKLYAERRAAKGFKYKEDNPLQREFEEKFTYEETPGQLKAINDVKADMENPQPMDRLVCGDVGFGKTEVAMRAAFKAVQNGKQVAVISPITILADQHFKSFHERMDQFNVRVEMLSRFRTAAQQKLIVEKLKKGQLDVIIGTHRLIQPDVKFKDLGLVIIDEEQRFGVKQKEKLKEMRKEVDVLTLTATPIPRTLNICLNSLRDITTITTPPFGRLPVITEVRKYSARLVREVILRELERGGQAYVLHNRVQTIDSFAAQLQELIPEARFGVAHGKLGAGDLEERIMAFKDHKYDVLVSSTIIENGIDLANANTLIVNNAERFGLAQLYQLRGRVGRGKKQAYAYFLYHGQRLKLDAKKRLRAIVEASDLGAGFQIAMKDLEIRGAGDILGANQHGVINVVGVAHFMRMLNKAVDDLKAGRIMEGEDEIEEVSIELPLPGYIPDSYIADSKEKINAYQMLSAADTFEYLAEIEKDFVDDYGKMPYEVHNLFKIIRLKLLAKAAGIVNVKTEPLPMSKEKEIVLHMSQRVRPANIVHLLEHCPGWKIVGTRLRINTTGLGEDWVYGLESSLEKLGESR